MNLARLDVPSLRLVVLCAESGSVSAAAPRASLSVTGASEKLRRLEGLLGVQLFQRAARGLVPTARGTPIIDKCREAIEAIEVVLNLAEAAGSAKRCPLCGAVAGSHPT